MAKKSLKRLLSRALALLVSLSIVNSAGVVAKAAEENYQVIVNSTFEDGSVGSWHAKGAPIAVVDGGQASNKALKVSGRKNFWENPTIDLISSAAQGREYRVSAWVKYDKEGLTDTSRKFNFTFYTKDDDTRENGEHYIQASQALQVVAAKGQWVQLSGAYTLNYVGELKAFTAYIDIASENPYDPDSFVTDIALTDYCIDNVVIEAKSDNPPPAQGGTGMSANFEDGTVQNWYLNGSQGAGIASVTEQAHNGSRSLKVSGRQAFDDVPKYDLKDKLAKGKTYDVSAWVKYTGEGPEERKFNLTMYKKDGAGETYAQPNGIDLVTVKKNEWTKMEGTYTLTYTGDLETLYMYVEVSDENPYVSAYNKDYPIIGFYVDDVAVIDGAAQQPQEIETDIPDLWKVYKDYFRIGAALEPGQIGEGDVHRDLLAKHYNTLVAENSMKQEAIHPEENRFNFGPADQLVDFAIENNMAVRGHTFLWHQAVPGWMFVDAQGNQVSKEVLLNRLTTHITTIVNHFETKYGERNPIYCWDVMNEVVGENGGLRDTKWKEILGDNYIEEVFKIAREATKGTGIKLFLNEYMQEVPAKGETLFQIVKGLKEKGLIDGVGYQAHISMYGPSVESMRGVIERFAALGVDVEITELDMSVYASAGEAYKAPNEELQMEQAMKYKELFDMFKEEAKKGNLDAVTFWGMADDHTWLDTWPVTRKDSPFLFGKDLKAKLAYWALVDPSKLPVYIQKVTVPKGTPEISSTPDRAWNSVKPLNVKNFVSGNGEKSVAKVMWDEKNLYVLVDVKDSTYSTADGVEVFVNLNDNKVTSYKVSRKGAAADGIQAAAKTTETGYVVQVVIPVEASAPALNKKLGFDLRITDGNNIVVWNDTTNSMNTDTSKYGVFTLGGPAKLVNASKATPVIDGQVDDKWSNAEEITTNTWVQGSSGAQAKVKTLWDENYLYVLAQVTDSGLDDSSADAYQEDSVEIFIDENNGKTASYEKDDAQYRVNFKNVPSFSGGCNTEKFKSGAAVTDTGYVVEAAIPLNTVSIEAGRMIGFDIQVNGAAGGIRTSTATWSDTTGSAYQNTSVFGNLQFAGESSGGNNVDEKVVVRTDNDTATIIDAVNDAVVGAVEVNAAQKTTVDSSVFEAIKGKDKEISFVVGDVTWTFNGKDIKEAMNIDLALKAVNAELSSKIKEKVKSMAGADVPVFTLSFKHDGKLPGKAEIKVLMGTQWANKTVSFFNYDSVKNTYELVQKDVKVDGSGYAVINLEHCSDYFAVEQTAKVASLPKTGTMVDYNVLVFLGFLVLAGGAVIVFENKRRSRRTGCSR